MLCIYFPSVATANMNGMAFFAAQLELFFISLSVTRLLRFSYFLFLSVDTAAMPGLSGLHHPTNVTPLWFRTIMVKRTDERPSTKIG